MGEVFPGGDLPTETETVPSSNSSERILSAAAWLAALALVAVALVFAWRAWRGQSLLPHPRPAANRLPATRSALATPASVKTPPGGPEQALAYDSDGAIRRRTLLRTIIPSRPRQEVETYTVEKGDSVFEIAARFNLKPETVLWSNYATLKDNPDQIEVGMELLIPPVDGVLHTWQPGDTLDSVAAQFKANPQDILNWTGNNLDLTAPTIEPSTQVVVPGGQREFRQWVIPTIPRGQAGVSSSVYGEGACQGPFEGAYGTGTFVWPAANHQLSGNDYWPGHLAIDIAAGDGASIFAADAGVVVFAGWSTGGYGNTAMIDHGNGYQTLYAHMSKVLVRCGQSVGQGAAIGIAGTTGNSTGTHLHFEVRYLGGFLSPWTVLP